jgi:hypothetical protein
VSKSRFERSDKAQRAEAFRKLHAQRDVQMITFARTLDLCRRSTDVNVPGTFAHDVVEGWLKADRA